jgi:GNAT superfamily N-acetyltransferase
VSWGWLHATSGIESVTLWSPPERSLVPDEHIGALLDVVPEIAPGTEERIHQFFGRVEEHHPTAPHWYLSVFATDTAHRGRGLGMSLLRRDLEIVDGTHLPCYLESSNPANEDRYRSVGFETIGAFPVCDDGPTMTMMWRDAR